MYQDVMMSSSPNNSCASKEYSGKTDDPPTDKSFQLDTSVLRHENHAQCKTCNIPDFKSSNSCELIDQNISKNATPGTLNDLVYPESTPNQDNRPPLLSPTETFEAYSDSDEDDQNHPNTVSNFCIGGLLKTRFQSLGSSFGGLLGIQVPQRVVDQVPTESGQLDSPSLVTPSSHDRHSIRSDGTLPSLPELVARGTSFIGKSIANTRILISPRNASLTGGFCATEHDEFSSIQKNNHGKEGIENLFSNASNAEMEENYSLALELFQRCLSIYVLNPEILGADQNKQHFNVATIHHHIGSLRWKMGKYDKSLVSLHRAKMALQKLMNRFDVNENRDLMEQLCDVLNTTGKVHLSKGDYKLALNEHEESLLIMKTLTNIDDKSTNTHASSSTSDCIEPHGIMFHPGIARSMICIGTVHATIGRLTEAMDMLKGGLEIQRKIIGSHHVDIAATLNAIGSVYEKSGRHEKAMQCYKKARQIYIRQLGECHVDVAVTMNNIGQIYHHVGKYQKAMDTYRDALRIMEKVLGRSHRNVAATLFNMGLVHAQCCQHDKALEIFRQTLQLQRVALGDVHADVALTLESIGSICEQRLQADEALKMYHKALRIRQKSSGDRLFIALTMDKIGKCQMNFHGDVQEAIACFEKSINIYRECGIHDDEPLVWEARKNYHSAANILKNR